MNPLMTYEQAAQRLDPGGGLITARSIERVYWHHSPHYQHAAASAL